MKKKNCLIAMVGSLFFINFQSIHVMELKEKENEGNLYIKKLQTYWPYEINYTVQGIEQPTITLRKQFDDNKIVFMGTKQDLANMNEADFNNLKFTVHGKFLQYLSTSKMNTDMQENFKKCQQITGDCLIEIGEARLGTKMTYKVHAMSNQERNTALAQSIKEFPQTNYIEPRYFFNLATTFDIKDLEKSMQSMSAILKEALNKNEINQAQFTARSNLLQLVHDYAVASMQLKDKTNQDELTRFIYLYQNISAQQEKDFVKLGHEVADKVKAGKYTNMDDVLYINDIVNFMWYLFAIAIEKNEIFSEGSFIIDDPFNQFFDFLIGYAKIVDPTIQGKPNDPQYSPLKITKPAYVRSATHLEALRKITKSLMYGIDTDYYSNKVPTNLILPAGYPYYPMKHILFGKVDKNRTFIKLEPHGLWGIKATVEHGMTTIPSIARKFGIKWGGEQDEPTTRRERIPLTIRNDFTKIIKQYVSDTKLLDIIIGTKNDHGDFEIWGIQYLTAIDKPALQELINNIDDQNIQKGVLQSYLPLYENDQKLINQIRNDNNFKQLLNQINQNYKNNNKRFGREVIINNDDLVPLNKENAIIKFNNDMKTLSTK